MTAIHEYVSLRCPFDRVPAYLFDYLAQYGARDGKPAELPVRVDLGELVVEAEVLATLRPAPSYPGYELMRLEWTPKEGGPYPSFEGLMSIADEGGGFSRIDLDGTYSPPLGPLGVAFDAALGHRFAHETIVDLLARFKTHCEAEYSAETAGAP